MTSSSKSGSCVQIWRSPTEQGFDFRVYGEPTREFDIVDEAQDGAREFDMHVAVLIHDDACSRLLFDDRLKMLPSLRRLVIEDQRFDFGVLRANAIRRVRTSRETTVGSPQLLGRPADALRIADPNRIAATSRNTVSMILRLIFM